ncbi:ROK family transcriptional regulator [Siculibacillus lacustris]|uniref:ROK family transcriptional regulator n=1 Tax=Siculibacillus lacustris TaxID=1549641 RepID=A0A4Q9VWI4_9HYPH|nr:ROK family transcriptional regulator [Siculibacillus lacustris]TBW40685.1 ROK family transcriptional regulator [Siculibacillus lacustris]
MKTADPELMRAINRFHVVDAIRRFGPIARVEICERTELSPTTVSAITAALIDDRLIMPIAIGGVRDETARGRPRVQLTLNPDAAYVVGVKLAPDQITVATTNFRADVLESLTVPVRLARQSAAVIADLVEDGVRRSVADAGLTMAQVAGVCVGLPGIVARDAGVCRRSPIFGERDVPFAAALAARLAVPVTLDNDVNLVTLAEHWFGRGRGLDDFLVVSVEQSLGLGIIHRGEVFRAPNGLGPDLGDLLVRTPTGADVRLGEVASGAAILAEIAARSEPERAELLTGSGRGIIVARDLAEAGDADVTAVLAQAGVALGLVVANLIALFAPPRIILVGAVVDFGPPFLGPLTRTVEAWTPGGLGDVTEIVHQRWGDDIWARGAAAMTLRNLYGSPWNTTGPVTRRPPR